MKIFALFLSVLAIVIFVGGCDEGMDMVGPVVEDHTVKEPTEPEPPEEKPPIDSGMMGDMKKPEEPVTPEPEPEIPEEHFVFFTHGDGTSDKLASEHTKEELAQNEADFVGCIFIPKVYPKVETENFIRAFRRYYAYPLSGVTVTIVSGPRSGETTTTHEDGQYIFSNVDGDELHLRVEKEHMETKEVMVHRSRPTSLPGGITPNYDRDPQQTPGNILMGQVWPEKVRFILQQTLLPYDLLYIQASLGEGISGGYGNGIAVVDSDLAVYGSWAANAALSTLAHEIAHAHQYALVAIDGNWQDATTHNWRETDEGKAYKEARDKDWEEHGKNGFDWSEYFSSKLHENAAETCAYYWSIGRWENSRGKIVAPNRLKWAKEWLTKQ